MLSISSNEITSTQVVHDGNQNSHTIRGRHDILFFQTTSQPGLSYIPSPSRQSSNETPNLEKRTGTCKEIPTRDNHRPKVKEHPLPAVAHIKKVCANACR